MWVVHALSLFKHLEVEELNVDQLKRIGALKFVKQFESEEELEVEVMVKYGGLGNFKMFEKWKV